MCSSCHGCSNKTTPYTRLTPSLPAFLPMISVLGAVIGRFSGKDPNNATSHIHELGIEYNGVYTLTMAEEEEAIAEEEEEEEEAAIAEEEEEETDAMRAGDRAIDATASLAAALALALAWALA